MIDGVCGRESVRFEQCAKMLTAAQYGQLKQSLTHLAKESANKNFNKADVSIYRHFICILITALTLNVHTIMTLYGCLYTADTQNSTSTHDN